MIKQKLLFIVMAIAICGVVRAQETINRDSLLYDFTYFIDALENTHPDPYSAFGGKVNFRKEAYEVKNKLRNNDFTRDEFVSIISEYISCLGDSHTGMRVKASNAKTALKLPLVLSTASDELFISAIPKEHKELLGGRLVSVNKIPIKELILKTGKLDPIENYYGKCHTVRRRLSDYNYVKRLLPGIENKISVEIKTNSGAIMDVDLTYLNPEQYKEVEMEETPDWVIISDKYIAYQFVDNNKKTMHLRMSSVMAREAFVIMHEGNYSNFELYTDYFYKTILKCERPKDVNEAINKMPSFLEIFNNMLMVMKENNSENLIIDLRENTGGFTPITIPTLCMLYGDRYFETDMSTNFYRLISPLYLKKIGSTLEEFNEKNGTNYKFGDYVFRENVSNKFSAEEKRENYIEKRSYMSPLIKKLDGKPVYEPKKVIVITNERTFSAGFHYAYYLWKMGATVVGVPSCQAPNTYMEATSFTLPSTKLGGSISNSLQEFLPSDHKCAKTFYPTYMMKWDDYKKYNFNKHAEIMYVLDLLKDK